jgi:hypothetical protein
MTAARALLDQCIDYAGMFPPAGLSLEATVRNYAAYRAGADAWALGRLVLPASRLAEFRSTWPTFAAEWPVSVLLGADYGAEIRVALELGSRLEVVECRPARVEHVAEIRRRLPAQVSLFVETPVAFELNETLAAIADAGACAKIRTGGVTAEAIPTALEVALFLVGCARRGLRLKATAGLHHAIRAEHRLNYKEHSATAQMHGFVNFFVAAAVAYSGAGECEVEQVLQDSAAESFDTSAACIRWRERSFSAEKIEVMRERFATSFGSCSFEEPMIEMRTMGWL